MQRCPDQQALKSAKPEMRDKITCCYKDLCNNRSLQRHPRLPLTAIIPLLIGYILLVQFR
ncbi:hypothetical protein FGIG_07699 [Fasciola gigantica]|uniref:Uncharacterized protein n=1 Tax=Fasciola gigantica TaxID=46835 RepID=A0A504YHE4_FASGI|nr:hypothetical protein FGIG_07699 [Fasciola gigantica]